MNRGMFDMMMRRPMMRDGRNPYGSRGGYITSRDPRRRDRARSREDYNYGDEEYRRERRSMDDREHRYPYEEDGHYYPFEIMGSVGMEEYPDYARGRSGRYIRDRYYDYPMMYDGAEEGMLTDKELEHWAKKLLEEVDEKDKPFFRFENIKKKAEDMGIKFDNFSPMELYVATLAMYTDYGKTLGSANMDTYIRLGKDFLCDTDAGLQYGMKLAAYYDSIVEG